MSKVTRARFEVSGSTDTEVRNQLLNYIGIVQQEAGGRWEIEGGDVEVQTARNGYWGRVTIRRQDAQGDPVSGG